MLTDRRARGMRGVQIGQALSGRTVMAMLLLFALFPQVPAKGQTSGQPAESATDLGKFWPLNSPPRKWNLIADSQKHSPNPKILMTVENQTLGPGKFILWFSNKQRQAPGKRDGELYRLCNTADRTWLFMDSYMKDVYPPTIHHDVVSDKILFSPSNGAPLDLIGDGYYKACGTAGQPYLLWSNIPSQYRIQVWGHLTENPKFRWYWDATVTNSEQVVEDCLNPVTKMSAVKVREAWWSSFRQPSGDWDLGSGDVEPRDGAPSGSGVTYGRTVWHGAGQLPYLMTAGPNAPAGSGWCVNEIGGP